MRPETVRTILFQGWANAEDLPEEVKQIARQQLQVRKDAIKWLNWKDAKRTRRGNIVTWATVIAAIASVIAAIASVLAWLK